MAAHLSADGTFVNVAARAGEISLKIGIGVPVFQIEDDVRAVVKCCEGMGGTLKAVGFVLQACITEEIMTAK